MSILSLPRCSESVFDTNADLPVDIFSHMGRKWRLWTIACGSLPCS